MNCCVVVENSRNSLNLIHFYGWRKCRQLNQSKQCNNGNPSANVHVLVNARFTEL